MKLRWLAVIVLIPLAGCSKIHEQRSFTIESGGSHSLQISAPLSEQKLAVVLTSDQPVNIWVILEKSIPEGKDDFDPEALKDGVVAKELGKTEATLSATIPAKEKFRIFVDGVKKKASVTVKIDSQ